MLTRSKFALQTIQNCPLRDSILRSINPQLFDVSLRDGIQAADALKWPTERKKEMFQRILETERPAKMEVGALVSPKILPIMGDSVDMYVYARDYLKRQRSSTEAYLLVPSLNRLYSAINYGISHMSFLTSVSESFQMKNTRRTLAETKTELGMISRILSSNDSGITSKLYISCINECPIEGKIDMDFVLREILMYHTEYQFDELCLSDTCGTLTFDEYEYLLDALLFFGIPANKLSLHLHVPPHNQQHVRRILWHSFDKHVNKFDVSMVETGGCSVTMDTDRCLPNLSYDLFYEMTARYIEHHLS